MKLKYKVLGIEVVSLLVFFLVIISLTGFISVFNSNLNIPENMDQEFIQSMNPNEIDKIKDSMIAYSIIYGIIIILSFILGLLIYNLSRYIIWEYLAVDESRKIRMNLNKIKKYFVFNTCLTILISLSAVLVYYAVQWFFNMIPFLLRYIPSTVLQQIITIIIPITVLYYASTNIIYNTNYIYMKKGYKNIIKELKYQLKPNIVALVGIFVFNWILLALIKPGSLTANLIGSFGFLIHTTYLKLSVKKSYENGK
jgi:hypothetical protein